jgi:hypothetical protein
MMVIAFHALDNFYSIQDNFYSQICNAKSSISQPSAAASLPNVATVGWLLPVSISLSLDNAAELMPISAAMARNVKPRYSRHTSRGWILIPSAPQEQQYHRYRIRIVFSAPYGN